MQAHYEHTQKGPLWLVLAIAFTGLVGLSAVADDGGLRIAVLCLGVLFLLIGAACARLTVRETEHHLDVRFGPLPLAGTKVRYDAVRSFVRARSRVIDGWGMHWLPGRGWTFNLWGFDCVELTTDRGVVRIGTDDADGLLRHLAQRTGLPAG